VVQASYKQYHCCEFEAGIIGLCSYATSHGCFALYAQLENYSFNTQTGSTEAEVVALQCKL